MRTIYEADNTASRICGPQTQQPGVSYRVSSCCLEVPCEDGTILYHTMTGAMYLLSPGETMEDHRQPLLREWFFVPQAYRERKQVDDLKCIAALVHRPPKGITSFTVFPTTDCNARCFYCYETGIRKLTMSPDTAHAVARYIADACGGQEVTIRWFGGEPFYNTQAVDIICADLASSGVAFTSLATSNGYYLTPDMAGHAAQAWHLKGVQIALDGTEQVYNRTKAYVDENGNPYLRVLENIAALMKAGIRVTVRLNLHKGNAADLMSLCDELAQRFPNRDKLRIYVIALKNRDGEGRLYDDERAVEALTAQMHEKIAAMGCGVEFGLARGIVNNQCMADNDHCEVIFPDGTTGRCEHYAESEVTGSIYSPERDAAVVQSWKERVDYPACATCVMYPVCIKLKKCFWQDGQCTPRDQERKISRMRKSVLLSYSKWKTGQSQAAESCDDDHWEDRT